MKVLIVDDERPARSELSYLIQKYKKDVEILLASSGTEALEILKENILDLAFIDIDLTDTKGTILARQMKEENPNLEVVFATAYNNYADKAFEIDALYYILKPFDDEKIVNALEKYEKVNIFKPVAVEKLSVPNDKKTKLIDMKEIVYIETDSRHCIVHTKTKSYKGSMSLNICEQKLRGKSFFRIHKSFLINLEYVEEIYIYFQNTTCVKLKGYEDKIIPVSRGKLKELKQLFYM